MTSEQIKKLRIGDLVVIKSKYITKENFGIRSDIDNYIGKCFPVVEKSRTFVNLELDRGNEHLFAYGDLEIAEIPEEINAINSEDETHVECLFKHSDIVTGY
jgi:hypothetical protein